jgi:hypothetical protein
MLKLPPAREIDALVHEHQAAIANALVDLLSSQDSAGDKLYRILVAPAVGVLPKDAAVIIVPDGSLHGINFETLPVDGARRHYWIEDVAVQVAPSLAALTSFSPAGIGASATALVVGNPARVVCRVSELSCRAGLFGRPYEWRDGA